MLVILTWVSRSTNQWGASGKISKTMELLASWWNVSIVDLLKLIKRERAREMKRGLGVGVAFDSLQTFVLRIPRLKSFITNIRLWGAWINWGTWTQTTPPLSHSKKSYANWQSWQCALCGKKALSVSSFFSLMGRSHVEAQFARQFYGLPPHLVEKRNPTKHTPIKSLNPTLSLISLGKLNK